MVQIITSLNDIPENQWNELTEGDPFLSHAYLSALEETNCVGNDAGWSPCHIILKNKNNLVGAIPLYLKTHSYGEYVFDWAWADAYARSGLNYYPKLVSAIPFAPISGARLLAKDPTHKTKLIESVLSFAQKNSLSSFHCLFSNQLDKNICESFDLLSRQTIQFHWRNKTYTSFEDYLNSMNHKNRKKIKQERRRLRESQFKFDKLLGNQISTQDWEFFYQCYLTTYRTHHSMPYLNLNFFLKIANDLPQNILLIIAKKDGQRIAAAFNIIGKNTLYGRYWGTTEFVSGLHFEVCYYQALEFCIQNKIRNFEGGAQGEHKLARGLEPVRTFSSHWLAHPQFKEAIGDYLSREESSISNYVNELEHHSPFKKNSPISKK